MRPALLLIAAVACTALPAVTAASGQLPSVQLDQPALLGTSLLAGGARRLRHEGERCALLLQRVAGERACTAHARACAGDFWPGAHQ